MLSKCYERTERHLMWYLGAHKCCTYIMWVKREVKYILKWSFDILHTLRFPGEGYFYYNR